MSIFSPKLETQIQAEAPIRAPEQFSPLAAIAEAGSDFLRATRRSSSEGSASRVKQANTAALGIALDKAAQLNEQGRNGAVVAREGVRTFLSSGAGDLPEDLKSVYEGVTGEPFEAFGYESEEDYQDQQVLASETGVALSSAIRAGNPNLTPEQVETAVFEQLNEITLLNQGVELERARIAAGKPIQVSPIVDSIQSDFRLLAGQVERIRQDGIVTKAEYDNAVLQTRALISSKYAAFGSNTQVKAIQDQMFGLLDDIGKGVSQDQLDVQLDAVQVALQQADFNPATIATVRALVKTNPEKFSEILKDQLGAEGESFVNALDKIWDAPAPDMELDNFFGNDTRPSTNPETTGSNPALMEIPSVSKDPAAYENVVNNFSDLTGSANPTNIIQSETARNSWIKTMNVTASAVASQSDEYILGEKLLNKFANNGVLGNLDAVYRTDPLNAAQTNDALQQALAAERIRNDNELNQRVNSGMGRGGMVVVGSEGQLQLNNELINANSSSLVGGETAWNQMRSKVEAAGGLEAFLRLPKVTVNGANPAASVNVKGQTYFLSDMLGTNFEAIAKLSNNMRLIDTKLRNLTALEEKYSSATVLFRGSPSPAPTPESQALASEVVDSVQGAITSSTLPPQGSTPDTAFTVTSEEEFDRLELGSYFVNPSDGRILRKTTQRGG